MSKVTNASESPTRAKAMYTGWLELFHKIPPIRFEFAGAINTLAVPIAWETMMFAVLANRSE